LGAAHTFIGSSGAPGGALEGDGTGAALGKGSGLRIAQVEEEGGVVMDHVVRCNFHLYYFMEAKLWVSLFGKKKKKRQS